MQKEVLLLPLFKRFIKDSRSGRRLKANGNRIRLSLVVNYEYVYRHLQLFSEKYEFTLRIALLIRLNKRQLVKEDNYWKKFYRSFSDYLYNDAGCHDNYVGSCFKCIRVFFNYLKHERYLPVGDFYKKFYVTVENVPVQVFMPEQLKFLINDRHFSEGLPASLMRTLEVVIFGSTVALRFSDIFNVKFTDITWSNGRYYLSVRSLKTETETRVLLPDYIMEIVQERMRRRGRRKTLFDPISLCRFNKNLKRMSERAGWTWPVIKMRHKRGVAVLKGKNNKGGFRFCDMVSSHIMRRTAITTMLMLGMDELVVRKISGHAVNSKAFYRYVHFAQSYIDTAVDKVHAQLVNRTEPVAGNYPAGLVCKAEQFFSSSGYLSTLKTG